MTYCVGGGWPCKEALIVPIFLHADGRCMAAQRHAVKVDKHDVAAVPGFHPLLHDHVPCPICVQQRWALRTYGTTAYHL